MQCPVTTCPTRSGRHQLLVAAASLVVFLMLASSSPADTWGSITKTTFYSPDRQYVFEIAPNDDWLKNPGRCRGTLSKVDGEKRTELWSRFLVNRHAPVQVFVSDSGRHVLTMDEWGAVGTQPVVVYGSRGDLIRAHTTESLGLAEDSPQITLSVSSYWWNQGAISFFGPDDETFLIRLHWGKLLVLNLSDGGAVSANSTDRNQVLKIDDAGWQAIRDFADREVSGRALRWLESESPEERSAGASLCGSLKLETAVPGLRKLLTDPAYYTTGRRRNQLRVYYVRKAAVDALINIGQPCDGVVVEEPEPAEPPKT